MSNFLVPASGQELAIVKIPLHRKNLLFISHEKPKNHGFGLQFNISIGSDGASIEQGVPDDPSTIYSRLPAIDPRRIEDVPKLSYFPSYSEMTPEQRGVYLRWLYDTSKQVDTGYVFTYFYGLERHLVFGNFEEAAKEIIDLRKHHDNGSFQSYSSSALVHACLIRKKTDFLYYLYDKCDIDYFDNSSLLILHHSNLDILPDMMVKLAFRIQGTNRRYLKSNPDRYLASMSEQLLKKFGKASYSFASRYDLNNVEGIPYPLFANISFAPEIRIPRLPNLLHHTPFQSEMTSFFADVHEATKMCLKVSRK